MKTSNAPSLIKIMSGSFAASLRAGLISSVTTISLCCVALNHATAQTLLTDSFLNPNAPTAGAELNANLANRQTGTLATVGYSSSTLNTGGPGTSGYAYLNENSNLEILPDAGTYAKVWTTTGFTTNAKTTISVDIWPTVTQNPGSGFASFLVGGGLANTQANEGVLWAGGAANAISVSVYGNGTLWIKDQSKFDGNGAETIFYADNYFTNNGPVRLTIDASALASGSQTLNFYLGATPILTNYTRDAGFTSDNYIGFQALRNSGATQSVFDNLSVTVVPDLPDYTSWATDNAGGQAANLDHDNDGVSNGVEFFMNAPAGFTANPGLVGNTVTWPNGGNIPSTGYGTQFVVQTSNDLVNWYDVTEGDVDQNGTNTASSLSYTLDPANNPAKQFVRLKVMPN
jgi:hypothetical protein